MELTVTKQFDNKLLSRNEVEAKLAFEGATPSRKDIQKALAKDLKAKEEMVVIKTVDTVFGRSNAKLLAHVYSDEKAMKANERKNLLEKHAGHEPKAEQEQE